MTIKKSLTTVNFTPDGIREIRGITMHSMWGTQAGSIAWFKNPDAKASAHYCISKDGEIVQTVLDKDMAWHAGLYDEPIADWLKPNPNFYCLGIELEDRRDPHWQYPDAQRQAAAWLVGDLMRRYDIPRDRIVLHKDLNPSRRSDPVGAFSLEWLLGEGSIQIPQDTFEKLVKNSTNWDAVWQYLELSGKPEEGSSEDVTKVIGGYKSRITTLEGDKNQLQTEAENRKEQVGRLKDELTEANNLNKSLQTALKEATQSMANLQGLLDACGREKGEMKTDYTNQISAKDNEIRKLKSRISYLEKTQYAELSFFDKLRLLFRG